MLGPALQRFALLLIIYAVMVDYDNVQAAAFSLAMVTGVVGFGIEVRRWLSDR